MTSKIDRKQIFAIYFSPFFVKLLFFKQKLAIRFMKLNVAILQKKISVYISVEKIKIKRSSNNRESPIID